MDEIGKLSARVAAESYNNDTTRVREINGYRYRPELSNDKLAVYHHPTERRSILGIRGTKLHDFRDLVDDISIIKEGHEADTKYFRDDKHAVERLKRHLPGEVVLAGHSRGGTSARKIANTTGLRAYTFNEGFSPKSFFNSGTGNVTAYRTKKDVISAFNPNAITLRTRTNWKGAHKIANFLE